MPRSFKAAACVASESRTVRAFPFDTAVKPDRFIVEYNHDQAPNQKNKTPDPALDPVGNNGKIAYSVDGLTWTPVSQTIFDRDHPIRDIAYGGGKFVAGGLGWNGKKAAYSSDGITWTAVPDTLFDVYIYGVGYGKGGNI
ncbi:hypothetical protein AGMMS50268_37790 [Spirochaetia bacterium]|nr:hypothetical protein AGMMS50268_37790 [Spirochaetia bacterium]